MAIAYLDGARLCRVLAAGAQRVRERRVQLNRINVFPVADGDTGTNMALTLSASAEGAARCATRDLGEAARAAAEAATLGAKGNSGVILAHWFLGLSEAFTGRSRVGSHELAGALSAATRHVHAAMEEVVEGTIVSVMRAVSERALECAAEERDLAVLLAIMESAGARALARTPEVLPVLARSRVVDAGAAGFVSFLAGVLGLLRGEVPPAVAVDERAPVGHPDGSHGPAEHPFCTEVVIRGRKLDAACLRRALRTLGSSLLVASTGEICKLHVHTARPGEVLRLAACFGDVVERKVDDMRRQRAAVDPAATRSLAAQPRSVAVVCDSAVDLSAAVRARHGIEMAPLQVLFGDDVYRDQIDLSTEDFYRELECNPHHPTTSQPPPREFLAALERIRADREVVVITISSGVSGTCDSARNGARLAAHPRVAVFDSRFVSLGAGMMVLNAARLASRGAGLDEILAWLEHWRDDTGMIFTLGTLEYLRRGGRIGRARSLLGNILGTRPVLAFEQGRLAPVARARGGDDAFDSVVAALEQRLPAGTRIRLGLLSIGESAHLRCLEAHLRRRCHVVEAIHGVPTGVIGAHAGPGTWGAFYQRVRDDDPLIPARPRTPCASVADYAPAAN